MASLLQIGLQNAAAAAALAVVAFLVCLVLRGRRPAIAHALWLLVLLKLLTPPIWTVALPWPAPVRPTAAMERPTAPLERVTAPAEWEQLVAEVESTIDFAPATELLAPEPHAADAGYAVSNTWAVLDWAPLALFAAWAAGSAVCLALVLMRSWRFSRLMRHATPAPESVRRRAARLAHGLGIPDGRRPEVWFVPGAVCPMLWAVVARRSRLLLPAGLWNGLSDAERDTLIVHELAHLRRRDHWVRLIEVAATVLYWWNPVVWWSRRRLREAEEQCCDAWVIWAMPRAGRQYISAILHAVEFVSNTFHPVPPTACGMAAGDFRQLKRRLTMIRQSETYREAAAGRTLGRVGLLAVCAGAAALLPLAPSLAQQLTIQAREEAPVTAEAPPTVTVHAEPTVSVEPVRAEVKLVPSTTVLAAPDGNYVVQSRPSTSAALTLTPATDPSARPVEVHFVTPPADVNQARAEVERLTAELQAAKARLAQLEQSGGANNRAPTAANTYRYTRVRPADPRLRVRTVAPRAENPTDQPTERPADSDRRMDELERKLDRLLSEVERIKEGRREEGSRTRSTTPPVSMMLPSSAIRP